MIKKSRQKSKYLKNKKSLKAFFIVFNDDNEELFSRYGWPTKGV